MIFERLKAGLRVDDADFDSIYPGRIKAIAEFHFTPVDVAITASQFLVTKPDLRVLDIGSGAGKFCMIGAACTSGHFTGVELRGNLYQLSLQLLDHYGLTRITFIQANITEIAFTPFDAVYLFNPFYEHIIPDDKLDDTIILDRELYGQYSSYVKNQLATLPIGTRLATYFSYLDEVPDSYQLQSTGFEQKLKLWKKVG